MSIIISSKGKDAKVVERSKIDKEEYLQEYIHDNPESIPIYEIKENRKLLIISREYETNSGPIDAIAIDEDGDIYIVETKLYKNTDKRKVVAQALDYGASLWMHSRDFEIFLERIEIDMEKKFNMSFEEKALDFFDLDEVGYNSLLQSINNNLATGTFGFIVIMDSMDERLKDLIIYINQNSNFEIYAVELDYYKFEEYEIMIPKIFGVEVKKNLTATSTGSRKKWDRESFIKQSNKLKGGNNQELIDLLEFCEREADKIDYGTGAVKGSFTPYFYNLHDRRSLITIISDGTVMIKVKFFTDLLPEDKINELISLVKEYIDPSTTEMISDDMMKSDSFGLEPSMFINGYEGIKSLITGIKSIRIE